MVWLYIAVGGAVGAVARYGLSGWVHDRAGFGFPWGTLAVNLLGCLLIGFALRALEAIQVGADTRALVAVGLLGSFTTFSTFGYETMAMLEDGGWGRAGAYTAASVVLGLVAVQVGATAAGIVLHARWA